MVDERTDCVFEYPTPLNAFHVNWSDVLGKVPVELAIVVATHDIHTGSSIDLDVICMSSNLSSFICLFMR